jgi:Helix-turn-helix domain
MLFIRTAHDVAQESSPKNSGGTIAARSEIPREVTTLALRDEWIRLAAAQKLSPIKRVVGMRLAHFYNGKTGQLNPSYATLAAECDTSERTAQKAVAAFRRLGMMAGARSTGGREDATNDFVLILPCRRVFTRTPLKPTSRGSTGTPVRSKSGTARGVHAGGRGVSSSVFKGCPAGHPNSVIDNSEGIARAALPPRAADDDRLSRTINAADDAPLSAAFVTADEAAKPVPTTQALRPVPRAADAARIAAVADQNPPCQAPASENIGDAANAYGANAAADSAPTPQPGYSEREFQNLRNIFPRREDASEARRAYRAVLAESSDIAETVARLQRSARRYSAYVIGRPSGFKIKTLAEFILAGHWRSRPAVKQLSVTASQK